MRIKDMDRIKEELKTFLPDYLAKFGREINGSKKNFKCPNESVHNHGDKNPSASIVPNSHGQAWKCFGCGMSGDIFHASYYLEGKEITGSKFIDTLTYLCDTFNVFYEEDDQQEEIIRLYEYAAKTAQKGIVHKKAQEYLTNRNLTEAIELFELGYCTWKGLQKKVSGLFSIDKVDKHLDKYLFDDKLIIPIRDENGDLVGFSARRFDNGRNKYMNSRTTDLYQKSRILYNLHNIKGKQVYVVEGYPDVWRLHLEGYPAVAPCGTAFTKEHLDTLHERGIKEIIFCFDGDKPGIEAGERVKKLIANETRFSIRFKFLPYQKDPDELINEQGKDAFEKVEEEVIEEPVERLLNDTSDRVIDLEMQLEQGGEQGYKLKWKKLEEHMETIQKGLYLVGGLSNVGKTTFMLQIYEQLAHHNQDLIPVFFSIDDDWKIPYLRLVASKSGLTIGQVKNYKKQILDNPTMTQKDKDYFVQKRLNAVNEVFALVKKAPIFDITHASKIKEFEETVKIIKEHTGKNVAMFIDNFHKIRDTFKEEKYKQISEEIKRITVEQELVTFATVELRKLNHNGRPTLDDIKESIDIVYDSNVVFLLHNDLHSKQGETDFYFDHIGKKYPIIELNVAKNKISAFKGKLYYKFIPETATFVECSEQDQKFYGNKKVERKFA